MLRDASQLSIKRHTVLYDPYYNANARPGWLDGVESALGTRLHVRPIDQRHASCYCCCYGMEPGRGHLRCDTVAACGSRRSSHCTSSATSRPNWLLGSMALPHPIRRRRGTGRSCVVITSFRQGNAHACPIRRRIHTAKLTTCMTEIDDHMHAWRTTNVLLRRGRPQRERERGGHDDATAKAEANIPSHAMPCRSNVRAWWQVFLQRIHRARPSSVPLPAMGIHLECLPAGSMHAPVRPSPSPSLSRSRHLVSPCLLMIDRPRPRASSVQFNVPLQFSNLLFVGLLAHSLAAPPRARSSIAATTTHPHTYVGRLASAAGLLLYVRHCGCFNSSALLSLHASVMHPMYPWTSVTRVPHRALHAPRPAISSDRSPKKNKNEMETLQL